MQYSDGNEERIGRERNASNQAPDENTVANEEMRNFSTQSSDESRALFQEMVKVVWVWVF